MSEHHLIFGSGQVGRHLARLLSDAGHKVTVVSRKPAPLPPGAIARLGDAMDPRFCLEAAKGAQVIYHTVNPPYDHKVWAKTLPVVAVNLLQATAAAGARLVVLDNVYRHGPQNGAPLDENSPVAPVSKKGRVRADVARHFEMARVPVAVGRASDFWGPGGTLTNLGDFFWPSVFKGKKAMLAVPPKMPHTYHYIPDVAAGLAAIGQGGPEVYGRSWILPCLAPMTLASLIEGLEKRRGSPIPYTATPKAMIGMLGLFMPMLREIHEMLYQWDTVLTLNDGAFRSHFPVKPTALETALDKTWAWVQSTYGKVK